MSTDSTSTSDGDGTERRPTDRLTTPGKGNTSRAGSLAMVAGGALILWAARTVRKNARKATLLALGGATMVGLGWRQRRVRRRDEAADAGIEVHFDDEDEKRVSDDAHVEATQDLGAGRVADESRATGSDGDVNPRGTSDRSDAEADVESEDDGETFEFVEEKEPGTHEEPHLDDEHDTRLDTDDEDERTQIDISDSAMADEASEAAGPQPEQAFPAMEGTDPEPQSARAPPRSNEGLESAPESEEESGADEGSETHEREESEEEEGTEEAETEDVSDETEEERTAEGSDESEDAS